MIEDNLYNSRSAFPRQKMPLSKKDKKWQQDCVNYIVGEGNITGGSSKELLEHELRRQKISITDAMSTEHQRKLMSD